jgi:hypothetical protein
MNNLSRVINISFHQYSIRMILLATAVAGIVLAPRVNYARRQTEAVKVIQSCGGSCYYSHEYNRRPGMIRGDLDTDATPQLPGWLSRGTGLDFFEDVVVVELRTDDLNPGVAGAISVLDGLRELYIAKRELLEIDVQRLRGLKKLRVLLFRVSVPPDTLLFNQLSAELPNCEVLLMLVGAIIKQESEPKTP